ncbi:hypothetical protein K7H91_24695 [Martelella mediterranea]|uniref:hypothetical protein n=1 Tax=Martelella mediterranea TaxID=293089 RepID=UPI001E447A8B|nr:hypothetical protein [Martelella mediterranea]MCD1636952.1 hypothetical protein [Martelella mediterranea]
MQTFARPVAGFYAAVDSVTLIMFIVMCFPIFGIGIGFKLRMVAGGPEFFSPDATVPTALKPCRCAENPRLENGFGSSSYLIDHHYLYHLINQDNAHLALIQINLTSPHFLLLLLLSGAPCGTRPTTEASLEAPMLFAIILGPKTSHW